MNTKPIGRKCVVAVIVLSLLFIFSACAGKGTDLPVPTDAEQQAETEVLSTEAPGIPSCPVECDADISELNGRINEDGWLKVISGGETVIPFEYDPVGEVLTQEGYISVEGTPLSAYLPELYEELPAVCRAFDLDLDIYEWGMVYYIDVFNAAYDMTAHRIDTRELFELIAAHDEELIIDVHIVVTGCEIYDEPVEHHGKGYAFILSAADPEAEAAAPSGNEPFLRLYSDGNEVGTHEFFMYAASACYDDDGKPTGMLCADGEAFFDPDHIAEAYEELPVYCGSRAEGLDIRLAEGAEIRAIYVYDPANGFSRMSIADFAELDRIIADSAADTEYVVEILVYRQGDHIEELDQYEYAANSYAFVVK